MAGKRSSNGNTQSHLAKKKQGLQDRVMQSRFVFVDKNEGKSTAENPLDTKASAGIVVPGYADPDVLDIRRDSPGPLVVKLTSAALAIRMSG